MSNDVSTEQDVLITRIFDAPREQVFNAWLDPDEVAAWYGPAHMEVPRESVRIDARVGGRWEVTMVPLAGGDGFVIGYEIVELVEPERLVMRSDPGPGLPDGTLVRMELHDHGPKTRMTLSDGPFPTGRDHAEAGYEAALDKLAAQFAA
ncbi:MAG TPA: SRPBCC domain-containing protein [Solirubrobacteraceae bacterium]|nr:SRPBCC domain-containing protein [Solirubrobacteraceae bacterium]